MDHFLWKRTDDSEARAKSPEGGAKSHEESLPGTLDNTPSLLQEQEELAPCAQLDFRNATDQLLLCVGLPVVVIFFLFFSPKPPSTWLYIVVVRASGCAMWDATSAWPDEQCHVCTQDPNQQNPGPPKQSTRT